MAADNGPVKKDHYSVLGVTPTSEDVVIRAAYYALIRRYHPDADPSEEAAERSRAINEAFAVLRDPEKRARYDGSLAAQGLISFEPGAYELPVQRGSRIGPAAAIGVSLLAVAMVAFALSPPIGQLPVPEFTVDPKTDPAPAAQRAHVIPAVRVTPVARPSTARALPEPPAPESNDPAEFKAVASALVDKPRVERAKPATSIAAAGTSRRSVKIALPKPSPTSSGCAPTGSRAEQMICGSSNLSSLDRQLVLLYRQSWNQADERKRAVLLGTRQRFNDRRDACGSPNCMTTAYVTRLKEISDIMAGRVQR